MTDPKINRARDAYRAYGQTTDFKNYQGLPMPEWDALPEKIREAWVNASNAAARYHEPVAYLVDDNTKYVPRVDADVAENIARLRATAARLEDGECVSFALVTVPEDDAPFYSYRTSGMEIAQMHRAAGEVCIGLEEVRAHLVKVAAVARLQWRHEEATAKGLPVEDPSAASQPQYGSDERIFDYCPSCGYGGDDPTRFCESCLRYRRVTTPSQDKAG